jgi:hypothetical protein
MSTKLKVPPRTKPILDPDGSPGRRLFEFMNSIPEVGATQTPLTITWTSNEPTASTNQTIANGSALTSTESGQAIQNINTVLTNLITELKTAGIIAS